jgi:hypothetical protein
VTRDSSQTILLAKRVITGQCRLGYQFERLYDKDTSISVVFSTRLPKGKYRYNVKKLA